MIAKICCCLLALLVYVQYLLYLMHMFQLNTYKNNEQSAWNKKNSAILGRHIVYLAVTLAGYVFTRPAVGQAPQGLAFAAICLLLILQLWFWQPKQKAKKPLVYTARVIRMLVTHGVLLLVGVPALVWVLPAYDVFTALIFYTMLLPWLILLVNRLNAPIQKAINRKFIKEAENKIKAMPELTVIGITGSYGKTSVKFFLTELLSGKYNVLCTPRNFNTDLGVTRTVREDLQPVHEVFVCEMGARYEKDIQTICDIVHPKYGVITAIGPQHLETFGSMDTIVKTKFELYDALPADGMAFLNYDNEYILQHKGDKPQIGFGESEQADVRLLSMELTAHGTDFAVSIEGKTVQFHTELIGYHNILDITAAIAVAHKMQVTNAELQRRVRRLHPVEHRLQLLPKRGRVSIIDDAYNSNPQGFHGAIDTLRRFEGKTRVLVTPGMIELGAKEYELNKQAGRYAATGCDYIILVGKKQTQPLLEGVREETAFDQSHVQQVDTLQDAWKIIPTLPGEELVVLLENDLPDNY